MARIAATTVPARGEIWDTDLDPTQGHEQSGRRPALIISRDELIQSGLGLVTILPITSKPKGILTHIPIAEGEAGLTRPSVVMVEQIRTISLARIGRRYGRIQDSTLARVEAMLKRVLDLA